MFWIKLKKAGNKLFQMFQVWKMVLLTVGVLTAFPTAAIASPLQQGVEAFNKQDYPTAVHYFGQAIAAQDEPDRAYSDRCVAHLLMNLPEQAVADCTAALKLNPTGVKVRFYRGLAEYRQSRFAEAIADFTRYLQQQPEDGRAYYNRGLANSAYGDSERSLADYHQAMAYSSSLTPLEMSNLYNDLGVAYLANAQPEQAIAALDQAIAWNQNDPRAYFNRGCVCHRQGNYAAALEDFERVLALDPSHAGTYLNRGIIREKMGNSAGAIADLREAVEHFQNQGNPTGVNRAEMHLQRLRMSVSAIG